jgi:putative ABC transport system ATP-binding protein
MTGPATGSALSLAGVTLTYPDGAGRLTALDDVSLQVDRGGFTVLVGPSGSGKSTLLAVAATLVRPDTGTVLVDGVDVGRLSDRERTALRRDRVGIVFQQPNLLDSLTATEQLLVTAALAGGPVRGARTEAAGLLDAVGMAPYAHRRPAELSGGQRHRVNIARALMGSPALLLVDEPTAALDHERGAQVMDLLRRVSADREVGTVVVTHDVGHLTAQDRVLRCEDGRVTLTPATDPAAGAPTLLGR